MLQTMNLKCLLLLALCLATSAHARETLVGQVTHVTDGDTLWVQPDGGGAARKLRMTGLDAPEICQQGGKAARDLLAQLALHRRVVVSVAYFDRYGRGLAAVRIDGQDLAAQVVRAGLAWSYGWRGRPGIYAAEEAFARQARLGVFAGAHPESPREFRKRHGSCHAGKR
jgi:endonuclease YncB( thermonuclease family)